MNELNENTNNLNEKKGQKFKNIMGQIKKFVKENKKLVAIVGGLILVMIIIAIILGFTTGNKETAIKTKSDITANTNAGIIKNEEYQGLAFTNVSLIKDKKQYTLTTDVTNNNKENFTAKQVDIVLKDENGNTLATLLGYIGDDLKPNETRTITASISDEVDLSKATVKEIVEHK